jgi:hypothetical protein
VFVATSRIYLYCLFSIYVLFGVLFYLFFVLVVSGRRYYLDAVNFRNLQDLQEEDFEQQLVGNQGKCSLTILIIYSSLSTLDSCMHLN